MAACRACGATLRPGARFCDVCGAAATFAPAPSSPPKSTRPDWLIPLLAGGAAALVILALALGYALTRGGGSDLSAFANRVNPSLDAVSASDRDLADRLAQAADANESRAVPRAADAVLDSVATAKAAVQVAGGSGRADDARVDLIRALDANRIYAVRVREGAKQPGAISIVSIASAARAARQAFAGIADRFPSIHVPDGGGFTTGQLPVLFAARGKSRTDLATYVHQVDRALANSASERTNISTVYEQIVNNNIDSLSAHDQLNAIISQRHGLQDTIAGISTPSQAQRAADLLREALAASIDDDNAILGMLNARINGDAFAYDRHYSEHSSATAKATQAKRDFIVEFNRLKRKVGESPLPLDFRF
jgi:hypothetical protein